MSQSTHKLRIGKLQATIRLNLGESGNWHSVDLSRSFKADVGWRDTKNLGYDDLLASSKLLDMAHTWILHQLAADNKARKQADNVTAK